MPIASWMWSPVARDGKSEWRLPTPGNGQERKLYKLSLIHIYVGKDLEAMYTGASTPEGVLQTIIDRRDEQAKLQKDSGWVE